MEKIKQKFNHELSARKLLTLEAVGLSEYSKCGIYWKYVSMVQLLKEHDVRVLRNERRLRPAVMTTEVIFA